MNHDEAVSTIEVPEERFKTHAAALAEWRETESDGPLKWFGAERRGFNVVQRIRAALDQTSLITWPDFEGEYIDQEVFFMNKNSFSPTPPPPLPADTPAASRRRSWPRPRTRRMRGESSKMFRTSTFGEYIRLLENGERWTKLGLKIDRVKFTEQLRRIRDIRNDVMHFDPDGITEDALRRPGKRRFSRFLEQLHHLTASDYGEPAILHLWHKGVTGTPQLVGCKETYSNFKTVDSSHRYHATARISFRPRAFRRTVVPRIRASIPSSARLPRPGRKSSCARKSRERMAQQTARPNKRATG